MASPREIASAFVRFFVKKDTLKADLEEVKRDVSSTSQTVQNEASRQSSSIGDVGKKIKDNTRGAREFASSITGLTAIWTGLLGSVSAVVAALALLSLPIRRARERSDEWKASLDEIEDAIQRGAQALRDIRREQQGINQSSAKALLPQLFEGNQQADAIREQIRKFREQLEADDIFGPSASFLKGQIKAAEDALRPLEQKLSRLRAIIKQLNTEDADAQAERERQDTAAHNRRMSRVKELYDYELQRIQQLQEAQQSLQSVLGGQSVSADSRILAGLLEEIRDSLRG